MVDFAKKNGFLTFYGVMDNDHGLSFGKNRIFDFSTVNVAADIVYRESMSDQRGYFGYEPYSEFYSKHCMGGKPAITQLLEYFHKFTKFASHAGIPFAAQMENEDLWAQN